MVHQTRVELAWVTPHAPQACASTISATGAQQYFSIIAPYVDGAKVTCKVEKQGKGKKIVIFKYKSKKGSTRRKQGHRQPYTKLTVTSIA